jgi:hypothetical protein
MELKEFMQKFLPNCEEKRKETETVGQCLYFYHRNFPEALKIFVDRICSEQRESDFRIIKALLPEHYTCEKREKGVFCKSETGIPDVWGNTEWQTFMKRVRDIFGERFMEVFHQVPPDHYSFTVYLEQPKFEKL